MTNSIKVKKINEVTATHLPETKTISPACPSMVITEAALRDCIEHVLDFLPRESAGILVVEKDETPTITRYIRCRQRGPELGGAGELSLGDEERALLRQENVLGVIRIHSHTMENRPPHFGDIDADRYDTPLLMPGVTLLGHSSVGCPQTLVELGLNRITDPDKRKELIDAYAKNPGKYFHIYVYRNTPVTEEELRERDQENAMLDAIYRAGGSAAIGEYWDKRGPRTKIIYEPEGGEPQALLRAKFRRIRH